MAVATLLGGGLVGGAEGTARAVPVAPPMPPQQIRRNDIQILDHVWFEANSATMRPQAGELLDLIAQVLKERPEISLVEVAGHASRKTDRGDEMDRWNLARLRAWKVKLALVARGLAAERLVITAYGITKPLTQDRNQTEAARNRRVEFVILKADGNR